jgi:hypothetical protein
MDKRYQVFISSTYVDLVDERQAVIKAVLELDHMPAGMELFPAIDDAAWELIKSIIDASDYYVLIIGGRYGSTHTDGLSFTEMEYDYAVEQKKRVIALLHGEPDSIPRGKTDKEDKKWAQLAAFRQKVSQRHTCQFWTSAQDLKSGLIVSLTSTVKRHPAVGWVRADAVPSGATVEEILSLRNKVAALEARLESTRTSPAEGTSHLQQGDDEFFIISKLESATHQLDEFETGISWDEIFGLVGPALLNETTDASLRTRILRAFEQCALHEARKSPPFEKGRVDVTPQRAEVDTCIIQLRALGLIQESQRKRSVTDSGKYWSLTPYGDSKLVQLRALKRDPDDE